MTWIFITLFFCVALVAGGLFFRSYMTGGSVTGGLFGPKPERRLEVIEQTTVDGRRKLVIVRRDNVEHLIMTGGPVDLVIETGIGAPNAAGRSRPALASTEPSSTVSFSRPARSTTTPPAAE